MLQNQVNAEWLSRPVDSIKKINKHQPLVLALTTMEQSLTFAIRFKKKLLTGPVFGEAYRIRTDNWHMDNSRTGHKIDTQKESYG